MKKLSYLMGLLLMGGIFLTSCSDDDDDGTPVDLSPVISFITGGDHTSADVTISEGDSILVGALATSNSVSGKNLTNFRLYLIVDNEEQPAIVDSTFNESDYNASYWITFDDTDPFTGKLYIEITDKDGLMSNASFNVTVEESTTPLSDEAPFTWQRIGANPGSGLDMFGLEWTSNGKEVFAQITKADAGAEKLVQLDPEDWNTILTMEDLTAAVDAAEGIDLYNGVSAEASQDYDDVIATKFGEDYFLIHIEHGDVTSGSEGTTITITGNYKE